MDVIADARCAIVLSRRFPNLDRTAEAMDHLGKYRRPCRVTCVGHLAAATATACRTRHRAVPRLPTAYRHNLAAGTDIRTPKLLRQLWSAADCHSLANCAIRRLVQKDRSDER